MSQSHRYFTGLLVFKWNGPFWFGPTQIFWTSFEGGPLWPVWSFRSVGPKCPFPFDKIVVPSPALLYPAYKNNNQTCGGLGRVCATGMYRSIAKFPKCWMESAYGIRIQREKFESNRSLCPVHADLYLFQTWDEIFFLRFGLLSARI